MKRSKGFTIIELIVVIAIVAVLASIVVVNVSGSMTKAKITRAEIDVANITKALTLFNALYGDYPYSQADLGGGGSYTEFYRGTGEPYLTVNAVPKFLSEFYKSDWTGYNADYFVKNGFYWAYLWDGSNDGKIGCGAIGLYDPDLNFYGQKCILCQDCVCNSPSDPNSSCEDYTFQVTPITFQ